MLLAQPFLNLFIDGIDYTSAHCNCTSSNIFWAESSALFAQAARGTVFFLGNGEETDGKGAYDNESFFGTIEVPNLNPAVVKLMVVMVVHREGQGTCTIFGRILQ